MQMFSFVKLTITLSPDSLSCILSRYVEIEYNGHFLFFLLQFTFVCLLTHTYVQSEGARVRPISGTDGGPCDEVGMCV